MFKFRLFIFAGVLAFSSIAPCVFAANVLRDKATVVCFGDSITNRGYPAIMGSLLGVESVNAGVGGNSTEKGLRRIAKDVLDLQPDVVVILFGTNDCRVDAEKVFVPLPKYKANLGNMVDQCKAIDAKVVLCSLPPINQKAYFQRHEKLTFDKVGGLNKLLADYRSAAQLVAEEQDVPFIDLNQLLEAEPKWLSRDGVHPSDKGNAIIARYVANAVRPLLEDHPQVSSSDKNHSADIVVYGGTSSGVIAAVQAARMNRSVILLEPSTHLGGLTSGGLGATDIGNRDVIGGMSREFYARVANHYAKDSSWIHETREQYFELRSKRTTLDEVMGKNATMWTFEPHVATAIFQKMLREVGVQPRLQQRIASVHKSSVHKSSVQKSGSTYRVHHDRKWGCVSRQNLH